MHRHNLCSRCEKPIPGNRNFKYCLDCEALLDDLRNEWEDIAARIVGKIGEQALEMFDNLDDITFRIYPPTVIELVDYVLRKTDWRTWAFIDEEIKRIYDEILEPTGDENIKGEPWQETEWLNTLRG